MMKKNVFMYISLVWTLVIFVNSLLPGDLSSVQSGFVVSLFDRVLSFIGIQVNQETASLIIRKFAHFIQFMILGILWMLHIKTVPIIEEKQRQVIIIIGMMTAVLDEGIQYFIPGRAASFIDVFIDWFGLWVGYIIINHIYKHIIHK